jgi:hypothetical protein
MEGIKENLRVICEVPQIAYRKLSFCYEPVASNKNLQPQPFEIGMEVPSLPKRIFQLRYEAATTANQRPAAASNLARTQNDREYRPA